MNSIWTPTKYQVNIGGDKNQKRRKSDVSRDFKKLQMEKGGGNLGELF